MHYCVVDIETTGGRSSLDRITEIAVYRFDGEQIVDEFHSLIDPECPIPAHITSLTGIDDSMVESAPTFFQIADELEEITKDAVFVAHSVNFDYGFIRKEFNRLDRKFMRKKLCTVRLARRILPGYPSYSLGRLCEQLGIKLEDRHRAYGDARATVEVLRLCMQKDENDFIGHSLKRSSGEAQLPPHLDKQKFDDLPEATGVYFFYDDQQKVIYIGKAKNLRSRVHSHFSSNTNTSSKHRFLDKVHDVSYELCGGELLAELTEADAIKKHWPPFNRSLKRISLNWGIYAYEDRNGYGRYSVAQTSKTNRALVSFKSEPEAFYRLRELVSEYQLCPRLGGVQFTENECHSKAGGACLGACVKEEDPASYNERYEASKADLLGVELNYILQERGRTEDEVGLVLVENGRYKGFGYVPDDVNIHDLDDVRNHIKSGYDDQDMQNIIRSYADKKGIVKVMLEAAG